MMRLFKFYFINLYGIQLFLGCKLKFLILCWLVPTVIQIERHGFQRLKIRSQEFGINMNYAAVSKEKN